MESKQNNENELNLDILNKSLGREYIDFKISQIVKGKDAVYASILAYKDARVDMEILDRAVGQMNWQCTYQRDTKGILQCSIGIKDKSGEWIWKTSNGIPSDFEGEKGEYSDAFKRAGFMWGIGRLLYQFPSVWIPLIDGDYYTEGTKIKASRKLRPNDWLWTVTEGYAHIKAQRKINGSYKTIFDSEPYKKQENE
jgi:hypothetical protein